MKAMRALDQSPFLKAMQAIEDSPALKALRAMEDSPALKAMQAFEQSPFLKAMQAIEDSPALKALRAIEDSPALKAMQALDQSPFLKAMQAIEDSSALKALRAMENSPALKAIRAFEQSPVLKSIHAIENSPAMKAIRATENSPALKAMRAMISSPAVLAITEFNNAPFAKTPIFELFERSLWAQKSLDDSEKASFFGIDPQVENEIEQEYNKGRDFRLLSEGAKETISYIYHYYFLPVLLSCIAAVIMMNAQIAQQKFSDTKSKAEVRRLTRQPQEDLIKEMLIGYRVVTGDSLRLRAKPSMKSEVISTLPIGTLVNVIDSSNRKWLYVQVEQEDKFIEGWVSRRFTTSFK